MEKKEPSVKENLIGTVKEPTSCEGIEDSVTRQVS